MVKLTIDFIQQKCKTDNFKKIKKFDVFSGDLDDITCIKELPSLEICSLSLNKVESLAYFSQCQNMQELYLRKNQVSDLFEVRSLVSCTSLKVLWLADNPISSNPYYRQFVVKTLPNLIKLDNT
jgi:Leucine-rich repeat (LRR) protein